MSYVVENWYDYEINNKLPLSLLESIFINEYNELDKIFDAIDICNENGIEIVGINEGVGDKIKEIIEKFKQWVEGIIKFLKEKFREIKEKISEIISKGKVKKHKSNKEAEDKEEEDDEEEFLDDEEIEEMNKMYATYPLIKINDQYNIYKLPPEKPGSIGYGYDDNIIKILKDLFNKIKDQIKEISYDNNITDKYNEYFTLNFKSIGYEDIPRVSEDEIKKELTSTISECNNLNSQILDQINFIKGTVTAMEKSIKEDEKDEFVSKKQKIKAYSDAIKCLERMSKFVLIDIVAKITSMNMTL